MGRDTSAHIASRTESSVITPSSSRAIAFAPGKSYSPTRRRISSSPVTRSHSVPASARAASSNPVTATPHTARATTPPRSTLLHVNRRLVPLGADRTAPPSGPVPVDVGEPPASTEGRPARRPMPFRYAVAAVTGSPIASSTSVIVNTHGGSPMFWAKTSTIWRHIQEPARYSASTCQSDRWCVGPLMDPRLFGWPDCLR